MTAFNTCSNLSLYRFLSVAEPNNFSNNNLDSIKLTVIEYLCDLFKNITIKENEVENIDVIMDDVEKKESNVETMDCTSFEYDDDFDPCAEIYEQVLQEEKAMEEIENKNSVETLQEKKKRELRERITEQVETYSKYCAKIDVESFLKLYGNDEYDENLKIYELKLKNCKNELETLKLKKGQNKKMKDASFVSNMFNIMKWWNDFGDKNYKEMSCGASILFGKPTHNGFQERVFSRGTYADCK